MRRLGGSGLLLAGVFLVFLGIVIKSDILEGLLDLLGFVVIIVGVGIGLVGLVAFFSGGGGGGGGGYDDF
jgi:hypothetical protein